MQGFRVSGAGFRVQAHIHTGYTQARIHAGGDGAAHGRAARQGGRKPADVGMQGVGWHDAAGQAASLRWGRSAASVDVVLGCQRMRCGD